MILNSSNGMLEDGREPHHVKIVAAIRGVNQSSTAYNYEVEDGTGFTEVKEWLDEGDPLSRSQMRDEAAKEHQYVRIIGKMQEYDGKQSVVAYSVRKLSSGNELTNHFLEVVHSALAWIVIAFLTSTAGFMLLRLKRGSFSGRLLILGIFAMVVYSFVDTALVIATRVLRGEAYEFSVADIIGDLQNPMAWVVVLWMAMTIVRSLRTRQAQTERYWGI